MKKVVVIALVLVALGSVVSCKKNPRCICFTTRFGVPDTCRSLEALGSDASCQAKNHEWIATQDSSQDMLQKTCIPE